MILIRYTKPEYLKYREKLQNPSLAISILDEAVAYNLYYHEKEFNLYYLMIAIGNCDSLSSYARKLAIAELEALELEIRPPKKILS